MQAKLTAKGEQLAIRSAQTAEMRGLHACAIGLRRALEQIVGIAATKYLVGPRPQHIQSVSQRLKLGLTSAVTETPDAVIGNVGDNVKYAAYHEFGFHGTVNVRAHTRINRFFKKSTGETMELRRKFVSDTGEVLGFRESNTRVLGRLRQKKIAGLGFVSQLVKAHQRKVNYAGKPFVSPALDEGQPIILEKITKGLDALKDDLSGDVLD
jgi:phage gpG-like protein